MVCTFYGCMPLADQTNANDHNAQSSQVLFAADCGPNGAKVLYRGECRDFQPGMGLTPPVVLAGPSGSSVHPALKEAGFIEQASGPSDDTSRESYVTWATEQVLLPVLRMEEQSLAQNVTETQQLAAQGEAAVLDRAAEFASLYGNLLLIDETIEELFDAGAQIGSELLKCQGTVLAYRFAAPGTLEYSQDGHLRPAVAQCLTAFSQTFGAVYALNETYRTDHVGETLIDPAILERQAGMIVTTRRALEVGLEYADPNMLAPDGSPVPIRQRIDELAVAAQALLQLTAEPLLLSQSLFPLLRFPVSLVVEGAPWDAEQNPDGTPMTRSIQLTLGEIAQDLVRSHTNIAAVLQKYASADYNERLGRMAQEEKTVEYARVRTWYLNVFQQGMMHALAQSLVHNRTLQAQFQAISTDQHWVIAMAVESMNAMASKGGYDEYGMPLGYQDVHDELLLQADSYRSSSQLTKLLLPNTAACIGLSVAAGIFATPLAFGAALGVCAMGTALGMLEFSMLARYSNAAMQLGYMGKDFTFFSPKKAVELKRHTDVVALLTIVDVFAMGFDVFAATSALHSKTLLASGHSDPAPVPSVRAALRAGIAHGEAAEPATRLATILEHLPGRVLVWGADADQSIERHIAALFAKGSDDLVQHYGIRGHRYAKLSADFFGRGKRLAAVLEALWGSQPISPERLRSLLMEARVQAGWATYENVGFRTEVRDIAFTTPALETLSEALERRNIAHVVDLETQATRRFRYTGQDLTAQVYPISTPRGFQMQYLVPEELDFAFSRMAQSLEIVRKHLARPPLSAAAMEESLDALANFAYLSALACPFDRHHNWVFMYQILHQAQQRLGLPLRYSNALDIIMMSVADEVAARQAYRIWLTGAFDTELISPEAFHTVLVRHLARRYLNQLMP